MCVFHQQQAEEVKQEVEARAREKREFRQKNLDAASTPIVTTRHTHTHTHHTHTHTHTMKGNTTDLAVLKKLDGSVKKNSAFVKKLVHIHKSHTPSVCV